MYAILTERNEIQNTQERLVRSIEALKPERVSTKIGFQGESHIKDVFWLPDIGIWVCLSTPPGEKQAKRYWNAFGIGISENNNGIVVEVNVPFEGINRRVAGAYAKGPDIVLLHKGKLNVHEGGLTMGQVLNSYSGQKVTAIVGGKPAEYILVARIDTSNFVQDLKSFVFKIDEIKNTYRKTRS